MISIFYGSLKSKSAGANRLSICSNASSPSCNFKFMEPSDFKIDSISLLHTSSENAQRYVSAHFRQSIQPHTDLLPIQNHSVSIPSLISIEATSSRAPRVQPFSWGLPFTINTLMLFFPSHSINVSETVHRCGQYRKK